MKKTILLCAILIFSAEFVSAQSFWKKLENVAKAAEKVLDDIAPTDSTKNTDKTNDSSSTSANGISVETSDSDISVEIVDCVRNGKNVTINFKLTNKLDYDIALQNFGGKSQGFTQKESTVIADNLGNTYEKVISSIGGKSESPYNIPSGTLVKGSVTIPGVSEEAKSFQTVKIAYHNIVNSSYYSRHFIIKSLTIN